MNLIEIKKTEEWVDNIPLFENLAPSSSKNSGMNEIEDNVSGQGTSNGRKKRKNRPNSRYRRRKLRILDPTVDQARINAVKESTVRMKKEPPGSDIWCTFDGHEDLESSKFEEYVPVSDNECEADIRESREKLADFKNEQLPRGIDYIIDKSNNTQCTVVRFAGHRIRDGRYEFDARRRGSENE
jgi:hypothetical protein